MKIKISIIILILSLLFFHFYAPKFIIEVKNPIFLLIQNLRNNSQSENQNNHYLNSVFTTTDGFKIHGSFSFSKTPQKGTLILVHGIRGNRSYFEEVIHLLNSNGYNIYCLDLRGHGQSEGEYCTFGVKEKNDIKEAIDHLQATYSINDHIGIWGQSLGGSVALQTMAIDSKIKFGIIESTFSSYKTVIREYFKRILKIDLPFIANYLAKRAATIANFTIEEAETSEICKQINQPIFMAHGNADIHIPISHGRLNFDLISSTDKTFRVVDKAEHAGLWYTGGRTYLNEVLDFIKRQETKTPSKKLDGVLTN